ncbi:hypothetical protein D9758_011806 [Tetrapyrgos nigripes]|uniref:Pali-domain-containing protein n=1 Tax=Tetrapyrgos nigripes TaxID=182062 RepID=A0A8H5CXS6_9AGAR|nr:hypothetical protein D9758_011806 [Tetrapyrgos nigripes]
MPERLEMNRTFCIPGILLLFIAFALNFLVSVSLPYLNTLDIARIHFHTQNHTMVEAVVDGNAVNETRFGIWAPCSYEPNGARICEATGHGYSVNITNSEHNSVKIIGASWTRGLAVHPVATGMTFIAFLLSFSSHITVTLVSSLVSFLASFLTLLAFFIDIALFAYLKKTVPDVMDIGGKAETGPGFWLTLIAFLLTLLAGCTVCFGRRRARGSDAVVPDVNSEDSEKPRGRFGRLGNLFSFARFRS